MIPPEPSVEPAPCTWTADEIRCVGYGVVDLIARHLSDLPDGPVFDPVPFELAEALLAEPMPARGESADVILERFARDIAPYPFGNGHPRFSAWVNSPPAVMGIFAAALAAAMNPSVAGGNHAAVWIERQVLEWFKALIGFPGDGMGLLVSGGSAAAIVGLAVARHVACARRGWDVRAGGLQGSAAPGGPGRLVVYRTSEGHGCNQKATELLGLGSEAVRLVPCGPDLRMLPETLDSMICADLEAGHVPMAVVASAGTVNTGAVDPLDAVADVCARRDTWLHVDGAYGAAAILDEGHRAVLAPLARADSIAIDPHKWLYVPVDAGLVLVRDAKAMRDTFSLVPPYLRSDGVMHGVQGPPWLSEFGIEQTRPFRALKVWMTLRFIGLDGYRTLIARDIALARHLAGLVREADGFALWEPQGLSIVCFRAVPAALHGDVEAEDALNRAVLGELQLGGTAFLSSTVIQGRFWLRACFINPRATTADVDAVFELVRAGVTARSRG